MNISEIQAGQGKLEIEAEVTEKQEPRTFEKFGKAGRVCNAQIKDASGSVKLTLWNEQVDQVNQGDKIKLSNGYASEFKGEIQISTGKFGTLEVIGKGANDLGEHILTEDEATEADALNEEMPQPDPEEEVTADELEEADLASPRTAEPEEPIDIEEEKVQ